MANVITKGYYIPGTEVKQIILLMKRLEFNRVMKIQVASEVRQAWQTGEINDWYFLNIRKKAEAVEILRDAIDYLEDNHKVNYVSRSGDSYVLAKSVVSQV